MIDIDAELLDRDPGWRAVLEAYLPVEEGAAPEEFDGLETEALADAPEFRKPGEQAPGEDSPPGDSESCDIVLAQLPDEEDEWLERGMEIDGVEPERLSVLHGRLIALGWLTFDVGDRITGVRYQLTREGYRVLSGMVPVPTLQVVTASDDELATVAGQSPTVLVEPE